ALQRADAADAGPVHAPDPGAVVRQLIAVPASLLERLVSGHHRELGEAVRPPGLLHRQVVGGVELGGCAFPVLDARGAVAPPLVQRVGADAQRADGADSGDYDFALHPALLTTRSIASPTVWILRASSPLIVTPYSSSMICESSVRSSESMSRSSNDESRE